MLPPIKARKILNTSLNLIIIAALLFSCNNSSIKPKTDWEKLKLNGKIKQVSEITFLNELNSFGEQDNNFNPLDKTITKYNSDGYIVETQSIIYGIPDSLNFLNHNRTIYVYDKNGFLIKFYNTTDSLREKRFNYDNQGNLIKIQWVLNSILLPEKSEYKYDQNNNLIEETDWDTLNYPKTKRTYKYDEKGNKREVTFYKGNKNGQLIFNSKSNYTCNNTGLIIESLSFNRNDLAIKSSFTYDKNGNRILSIYYNSKGEIEKRDSLSYQYDHNNNWIKKMEYSVTPYLNPLLLEIDQRIIEYY